MQTALEMLIISLVYRILYYRNCIEEQIRTIFNHVDKSCTSWHKQFRPLIHTYRHLKCKTTNHQNIQNLFFYWFWFTASYFIYICMYYVCSYVCQAYSKLINRLQLERPRRFNDIELRFQMSALWVLLSSSNLLLVLLLLLLVHTQFSLGKRADSQPATTSQSISQAAIWTCLTHPQSRPHRKVPVPALSPYSSFISIAGRSYSSVAPQSFVSCLVSQS